MMWRKSCAPRGSTDKSEFEENPAAVEDLAPKAKGSDIKTPDAKTIDGVHPNAAATRADPAMQPLLAEVPRLGRQGRACRDGVVQSWR